MNGSGLNSLGLVRGRRRRRRRVSSRLFFRDCLFFCFLVFLRCLRCVFDFFIVFVTHNLRCFQNLKKGSCGRKRGARQHKVFRDCWRCFELFECCLTAFEMLQRSCLTFL